MDVDVRNMVLTLFLLIVDADMDTGIPSNMLVTCFYFQVLLLVLTAYKFYETTKIIKVVSIRFVTMYHLYLFA